MGSMLDHETTRISIQASHGTHGLMHHIFCHLRRQHRLVLTLGPQFVLVSSPLVDIDGHLCSEGFGQDEDVSHLGSIGVDEFSVGHHGRGHAPNDGPWIEHGLSSRDGRVGFVTGFPKAPHHFPRANGPFGFGHIPTGSQEHEDKVTLVHSLRIEIRQHIGRPNASLQVGRIYEGKEKVRGGDNVMSLSRLANAAIQGDLAVPGPHVLTVAQSQILQEALQLLLRDLTGSSLEIRPRRQGPSLRKSNLGRIKMYRLRFLEELLVRIITTTTTTHPRPLVTASFLVLSHTIRTTHGGFK
eukprot:scaffold68199_cov60-Attheya_sp.AAC.1